MSTAGILDSCLGYCISRMSNCLLLVIAVLSHCTVPGSSENILAFEGGDVILPCSFNTTPKGDFPDVEWSKEGLEPNVVLLYRDGYETAEMKNPVFQYRTSFISKELKHGNISMRISNVRLTDAGKYQCMTLWRNPPRDITTVELVVGTVSEPKISVVSANCGGLTLQCEAKYSLPEPQITFLDDQGHEIPAEGPKSDEDGRGNYTVTRQLILDSVTNSFKPSITCRVQQLNFNLIRDTDILIPADVMKSCCLITFISIGWTILLFLFACGLAIWFWRRCGKRADGQKLSDTRRVSDQSPMSIFIGGSRMDQSHCIDNVGDCATETLRRQVAQLEFKLQERNETICRLLNTDVCQNRWPRFISKEHISTNTDPPKPATSRNRYPSEDRRNQRRYSSPALLSPTAPRKKIANIGRSLSETYAQTHHKFPKLRRHSSLLQPNPLSTNHCGNLIGVTEESEPLMSCEKIKN